MVTVASIGHRNPMGPSGIELVPPVRRAARLGTASDQLKSGITRPQGPMKTEVK